MKSKSETKRVAPQMNLDVEFMFKHAKGDLRDVQERVDRGVAKLEAKLRVAEEALRSAYGYVKAHEYEGLTKKVLDSIDTVLAELRKA